MQKPREVWSGNYLHLGFNPEGDGFILTEKQFNRAKATGEKIMRKLGRLKTP